MKLEIFLTEGKGMEATLKGDGNLFTYKERGDQRPAYQNAHDLIHWTAAALEGCGVPAEEVEVFITGMGGKTCGPTTLLQFMEDMKFALRAVPDVPKRGER